ncbi:cysteine protease LapG [Enterobacteriaceae bacterium C23F]
MNAESSVRRCSLGLALLLLSPGLWAMWNASAVNRLSQKLYGPALPAAQQNIDAWAALVQRHAQDDIRQKLTQANQFFNARIRFRDDKAVWQQNDYWATPVELLRKGAGDCEDFALAKYFTLRAMGVPVEQLRMTYVKSLTLNQAHMVLTWYATPDAVPLVLDNLQDAIVPATQRQDLLPVYSFNGQGLWLARQAGTSKRINDSKKLSRWQDLLARMRAEGFDLKE